MEQEFSFIIEEEVYEKFYLAVHLAKEDDGKIVSIWSEVEEVIIKVS